MPQIQEHGEVETVVRGHAGWVHACANRRVGNEAMAEDVTQAVFILFWRRRRRLGEEMKLTGWLYRAVRYCAADALRVKRIRERHEREAAMAGLRDRSSGEAGWSDVSPELEQAVDRLGKRDRAAVLLRFYRQMSFAEVGKCLGISEDAAQKRVERAVGKLREKLSGKGVEVEAGSLGAMVLAHAVEGGMEGGTAGLVEKVMAGIGGGSGNGTAGLIAKGAEKMMVMAKVKVAAVVVLVAIGLVVGWQLVAGSGPSETVQAAPPSRVQLPAAEVESKVPGSPYVYGHELLIEQGLCQAILKDATRVPSQGEWEVYRMPTPVMREWLVGAPKGRVHYSRQSAPSVATPEKAPEQRNVFENFYTLPGVVDPAQGRPFLWAMPRGEVRDRLWDDAQGVHFPLKGNDWKVEISGVPGANIMKSGTLTVDATLQPGESLLSVLNVGQLGDSEYSFIISMDVFKATELQASRIQDLREAELWTRFGPALCRKIADRVAAWQKSGHVADQVPPKWQKTLSDGTVVQLETVGCGSRWPGIMWDGDGRAVTAWWGQWGGLPDRLTIHGHVKWTTAPTNTMARAGKQPGEFNKDNRSGWTDQVAAAAQICRIRVPLGEFVNAGNLERRKPLSVGPLKVDLREVRKTDKDWSVTVDITGTGRDRLAYAVAPMVVTKKGRLIRSEHNMSEDSYYRDPARELDGKEPLSVRFGQQQEPLLEGDAFDHLELLWRKVEVVTFERFATTPAGVEMADLEKATKDAQRPVAGKAALVVPHEPTPAVELPDGQRPADFMQLLLSAIAAGDRVEMQKYLTGEGKACKMFTDMMLARQQLLDAVEKRLGTVPDVPVLTPWASFGSELVNEEYAVRDDGIAVCGQITCRRTEAGVWKLDVEQSFNRDFAGARMQEMTEAGLPMVGRLTNELNAGKITTAEQFRQAFDAMVKDLQKTQGR